MHIIDRSTLRAFTRGIFLTLTLVVAGSGCSSDSGNNPDFGNNDPTIIVALGDSITFGLMDTNVTECGGAHRGVGGFGTSLQAITGRSVVNEGVCGEDSSGGVDRAYEVLQRWRPGVMLIDYGANDIIARRALVVISNLRLMINEARANKTIPVLGTLVPAADPQDWLNPAIVNLNAQILDLCARETLECADHYRAFTNHPGFIESPNALLSDDGLHPNHAGYALMADTWARALKRVY